MYSQSTGSCCENHDLQQADNDHTSFKMAFVDGTLNVHTVGVSAWLGECVCPLYRNVVYSKVTFLLTSYHFIIYFPKMTSFERIAQINEHVHNIFPCSYIHGAFAFSTAQGLVNSIESRVNCSASD